MPSFLVLKSEAFRIENIYQHTLNNWGQQQADKYIDGMFEHFGKIASKQAYCRPIPAEFGVSGFFCRYQKHYIYCKELKTGQIGIVTILHERMHQIERFKKDFDLIKKS